MAQFTKFTTKVTKNVDGALVFKKTEPISQETVARDSDVIVAEFQSLGMQPTVTSDVNASGPFTRIRALLLFEKGDPFVKLTINGMSFAPKKFTLKMLVNDPDADYILELMQQDYFTELIRNYNLGVNDFFDETFQDKQGNPHTNFVVKNMSIDDLFSFAMDIFDMTTEAFNQTEPTQVETFLTTPEATPMANPEFNLNQQDFPQAQMGSVEPATAPAPVKPATAHFTITREMIEKQKAIVDTLTAQCNQQIAVLRAMYDADKARIDADKARIATQQLEIQHQQATAFIQKHAWIENTVPDTE